MKLKYYLRGAGIGVIVSTLILMIAFGVYRGKTEESGQPETENQATDLTIAEALSELATETESASTETEATGVKATETEAIPPAAPMEETETGLPEDTGENDGTGDATTGERIEPSENAPERIEPREPAGEGDGPTGEADETAEDSVTAKKTVSVVVQGGDSPMVVAHKLVTAGAVDDENLFYRYLLEHGLNDGIEIGTFAIPEGADYETVAKIITTNEYENRMQR